MVLSKLPVHILAHNLDCLRHAILGPNLGALRGGATFELFVGNGLRDGLGQVSSRQLFSQYRLWTDAESANAPAPIRLIGKERNDHRRHTGPQSRRRRPRAAMRVLRYCDISIVAHLWGEKCNCAGIPPRVGWVQSSSRSLGQGIFTLGFEALTKFTAMRWVLFAISI